ncbi:MAG: nucleotidyltransferase [Thermomicrobiales bacterium]
MNKHLPTYFDDFLKEIRPTPEEVTAYKEAHETLRERLTTDPKLSPAIVNTFLQGSYRRATAVRPERGRRSDVDVVAVTCMSEDEYTPQDAMDEFEKFLDTHYEGQWKLQGRSIGIAVDGIVLDLVVTSAPSEAQEGILKSASVSTDKSLEEASDWRLASSWLPMEMRPGSGVLAYRAPDVAQWKLEPLRIPDRDAAAWQDTHPLEQIRWTQEKNGLCNSHYVNVVKALKWWRRAKHPTPKYPKGYPVEHLIGVCCPDDIQSVAEGVTLTLEAIARDYQIYADLNIVPTLADHGVPSQNVWKRISSADFVAFHKQVCNAAEIARRAFDEEEDLRAKVKDWQRLFGDEFPDPPDDSGGRGGFTPRTGPTKIASGRFG